MDPTLEALHAEVERATRNPTLKTWEDLERRARTCPVLRQAVAMVDTYRLSREAALLVIAFYCSEERERLIDAEVVRQRNEPMRPLGPRKMVSR